MKIIFLNINCLNRNMFSYSLTVHSVLEWYWQPILNIKLGYICEIYNMPPFFLYPNILNMINERQFTTILYLQLFHKCRLPFVDSSGIRHENSRPLPRLKTRSKMYLYQHVLHANTFIATTGNTPLQVNF